MGSLGRLGLDGSLGGLDLDRLGKLGLGILLGDLSSCLGVLAHDLGKQATTLAAILAPLGTNPGSASGSGLESVSASGRHISRSLDLPGLEERLSHIGTSPKVAQGVGYGELVIGLEDAEVAWKLVEDHFASVCGGSGNQLLGFGVLLGLLA